MNKDDQFLISHVMDKCNECLDKNMMVCTSFLDIHQQSVVLTQKYSRPYVLFGGYDSAERKMACFLPDYMSEPDETDISVLLAKHSGYKKLSHRDYLGSLMSLGIKRENIGDIIVSDNSAQIIFKTIISNYLISNINSAGNAPLQCSILPISTICPTIEDKSEISKTVASLRLDAVISALFNLSRTQSCEYIEAGKVFVDNVEILKIDKIVSAGSKIVIRSKGKAVIKSANDISKKGRIILRAEKYF